MGGKERSAEGPEYQSVRGNGGNSQKGVSATGARSRQLSVLPISSSAKLLSFSFGRGARCPDHKNGVTRSEVKVGELSQLSGRETTKGLDGNELRARTIVRRGGEQEREKKNSSRDTDDRVRTEEV